MSLVHVAPGTSADEVHDILRRDGAVVIHRLADASIVDAITAEMTPFVAATPPGRLRQEENQYLSVPREVAETLDDEFLRLIGYRIGADALGDVDDVRDPIEVIRGRTGAMSFGVAPESPG